MRYRSTRAGLSSIETNVSFSKVLFAPGYASDGGLYVPESVPQLPIDILKLWKSYDYPTVVENLLTLFISWEELSHQDIKNIVHTAFKDFDIPEVIHLTNLNEKVTIAELFHGPTLAFKDLSFALLSKLLEHFLQKEERKRITLLVGTSGDTGPAAAHSIAGKESIGLILLYPPNNVSEYQELQMLSIDASNIRVYSVEGTSDDLDVPIKQCLQDNEFASENYLGSFNSLHWGRVLLQTAHYIYIYLQCCHDIGQELYFIVPTGAAGNLAAGYLAHEMGCPIKLVASLNVNDVLVNLLKNGHMSTGKTVTASLAPAMDIQAPYNVERLLYFAARGKHMEVLNTMVNLENCNMVNISGDILRNLQNVIQDSLSVVDVEIAETMNRCFQEFNYVLCPHSATAMAYYFKNRERSSHKMVCLATASPAKFPRACAVAKISPIPSHPRLENLKSRPKTEFQQPKDSFRQGENWTDKLKKIILDFNW